LFLVPIPQKMLSDYGTLIMGPEPLATIAALPSSGKIEVVAAATCIQAAIADNL
jgi:hypothetical protein